MNQPEYITESHLRAEMIKLWKETFHDTNEYVDLVFDNYFNPEYVATKWDGNTLVAALLGVPYCFGPKSAQIKGLYLCGLATSRESRKQGIMSELLKIIESRALGLGFDFTFLIPASDGLQRYYADRGYVPAFFKNSERFIAGHDFAREYRNLLSSESDHRMAAAKERYFDRLICKRLEATDPEYRILISKLANFVVEYESTLTGLTIQHSRQDVETAIQECFIGGGSIFYVKSDTEIVAVAFTSIDENGAVRIYRIFDANPCGRYAVLDFIAKSEPQKPLILASYYDRSNSKKANEAPLETGEKEADLIFETTLPGANQVDAVGIATRFFSPATNFKMYGMTKILNIYALLNFQIQRFPKLNFTIFLAPDSPISDPEEHDILDSEVVKISAKKGVLTSKKMTLCDLKNSYNDEQIDHSEEVMSMSTVAKILFQSPSTDPLVSEAFGIPSLHSSISLMLD